MIDMYFLIYKTKKQLYYYSFFACNCSNACNKVSTEYTAYYLSNFVEAATRWVDERPENHDQKRYYSE